MLSDCLCVLLRGTAAVGREKVIIIILCVFFVCFFKTQSEIKEEIEVDVDN